MMGMIDDGRDNRTSGGMGREDVEWRLCKGARRQIIKMLYRFWRMLLGFSSQVQAVNSIARRMICH